MRLYLRSRRAARALAVVVVLAALHAVSGSRVLTILGRGEDVAIPYRYVLSLFIAVTCVASAASPVPEVDRADTGPLRRARLIHLAVGGVGGSALVGLSDSSHGLEPAIAAGRAYLVWYALAVICAVWLNESMCWLGPMAAMGTLVWAGQRAGSPRPWNWVMSPPGAAASWLVAGGLLALASAVVVLGGRAPGRWGRSSCQAR